MSTKKNGVTTYYGAANGDPAPWETSPDQWNVAPNGEGGLAATKKNKWYDYGIPLAVGSIFGYGAFGPGGYASFGAGGGAGGGGGAAGVTSEGTPMADFLAGAPSLGSSEAGVVGGSSIAGAGSMGKLAALGKYGLPSVGDFLTSAFSSSKNSAEAQKQRDFEAQQNALAIAARQRIGDQQTALDESKLDPWRGTMSQVGDASRLDRLAGSTYTPVSVSRGPGGAINTSGGTTYNKSPELIAAAKAAAMLVLSGGGRVPTMTDPANYGKTGTTNLLAGGSGRALAPGAAPGTPDQILGTSSGALTANAPPGSVDNYIGTQTAAQRMKTPAQYLGQADDPWNVAA